MRVIPPSMLADLQTGATTHCRCWKLESSEGITGHTNHDNDLTFDGVVFKALQGLSASDVKYSDDLNADTQDLYGVFTNAGITIDDIRLGKYDNAILWEYVVDWKNVSKRFLIRKGYLGKLRRSKYSFQAEVRSLTSLLNFNIGDVYSTTCNTYLGSSACGVNLASFTQTGAVASVSSTTQFGTTTSGIADKPNDWYNFGTIEWVTGNNAGFKSSIKSSVAGKFVMNIACPLTIQVGDTFNVIAGCNKGTDHCRDKFNNLLRFRGFNRIPGNDILMSVAKNGYSNDGESLF